MWWWRGGRDHTQGRPRRAWSDGGGGGRGAEADNMPSRCETVPIQSQLSIQTHEPKVILSSMLYTASAHAWRCTTGVRCLNETPRVWASHQILVGKHVRVWTCHLLLRLDKSSASHCSNLYGNQRWQAVRGWFYCLLTENQSAVNHRATGCRPLPLFCYPGLMSPSFHGQWGTVKVRFLDWYQAWTLEALTLFWYKYVS